MWQNPEKFHPCPALGIQCPETCLTTIFQDAEEFYYRYYCMWRDCGTIVTWSTFQWKNSLLGFKMSMASICINYPKTCSKFTGLQLHSPTKIPQVHHPRHTPQNWKGKNCQREWHDAALSLVHLDAANIKISTLESDITFSSHPTFPGALP